MKILVAALLIVHGLIVALQSMNAFKAPGEGVLNPSWMAWWPINLGQSWLLSGIGLERMPFTTLILLINLAGGIALLAAGLGLLGILLPAAAVIPLSIFGAAISLGMLLVYLHPFYAIGIAANLLVLFALLQKSGPVMARLGI